MQHDDWPNLAVMFFDMARRCGARPFLWSKHGGAYRPQDWTAVADEVRALSAGLTELGVGPGDRVVLCAENRPNWVIADLAVMAAGAIAVPAYTTNTAALHEHVLRDSGARLAIVSTAALAEPLGAACAATGVGTMVTMEDVAPADGVDTVSWRDAKARGEAGADAV